MTFEEANALFHLPFMELLFKAHSIHRENFDPSTLQTSTLLSIKTGACSENCSYCAQSAHYKTNTPKENMLDTEQILEYAKLAKQKGSSRFCMGASGRSPTDNELDSICETIKEVKKLGLETCVTLGLLNENQAKKLKDSGLDFYNHNIDTSREYYSQVITTRTFEDRLNTIKNVRDAGLKICVGGILGMGESNEDRINMLVLLSNLPIPPESVPINQLVKIPGTPLENGETVVGESHIPRAAFKARCHIRKIRLEPEQITPLEETIEAIKAADIVIIGPGSLYTSVIPNLLIPGIEQAILDNRGRKFYVGNIMTQPGETDGYTHADHIHAIEDHQHFKNRHLFEYIVLNDGMLAENDRMTYEKYSACRVEMGENLSDYTYITDDFIISEGGRIRHDADLLARRIFETYVH